MRSMASAHWRGLLKAESRSSPARGEPLPGVPTTWLASAAGRRSFQESTPSGV